VKRDFVSDKGGERVLGRYEQSKGLEEGRAAEGRRQPIAGVLGPRDGAGPVG